MIPAIGLIIGLYTIVRYISFLSSDREPRIVRWASVVALILTLVALLGLMTTGSKG